MAAICAFHAGTTMFDPAVQNPSRARFMTNGLPATSAPSQDRSGGRTQGGCALSGAFGPVPRVFVGLVGGAVAPQPGVGAVGGDQVPVAAVLDDPATVQYHDPIGPGRGGQSV